MVARPSGFHEATETTVIYSLEGPFTLRHPTHNLSPMDTAIEVSSRQVEEVCLLPGFG
jgi:hypothetical protein